MVSFLNYYQKFTLFFLFTKNTLDMTWLFQDPEDPHSTTLMICQPPLLHTTLLKNYVEGEKRRYFELYMLLLSTQ